MQRSVRFFDLLVIVVTASIGCTAPPAPIDASAADASVADAPVCAPDPMVFATHVEPLVTRYCGGCHGTTPSFGAPVSLLDFPSLVATRPDGTRLVDRMAQRLADGSMPPVGMPRLPDPDANAIASWASCGAVSTPPAAGLVSSRAPLLAPVDPPSGLDAIELRASGYAVGPTTTDDYHCFVFDAPVDAPHFIRRFEMIYGEQRVLHHLVMLRDVDHHTSVGDFDCYDGSGMPAGSQYLYAWAPGQSALEFPSGGLRIAPGDRYIVQIHYNNGQHLAGVSDTSGVRLYVGPIDGPEYGLVALGPLSFSLPPHATTAASSRCTFTSDATILAGLPHMHLLGSRFTETIARGGGPGSESLISLSGWTFGTQLFYAMPTTIHAGDVVTTTCTYDNTRDGTVSSGENTTDEMCFDFLYATPPPTQRYCDEGTNAHPTDVAYLPGECLPASTTTSDLPLVTGTWTVAASPPVLTPAPVPDGRWILDGIAYYVTDAITPIGTIDLSASYVLGRGQILSSGGVLTYDLARDTVVNTESHVRLGGTGHDSWTAPVDGTRSRQAITYSCPASGGDNIELGLAGDELTIGFTSSAVPGQTLWPRFVFRRAP
jgi:hypothetical protein